VSVQLHYYLAQVGLIRSNRRQSSFTPLPWRKRGRWWWCSCEWVIEDCGGKKSNCVWGVRTTSGGKAEKKRRQAQLHRKVIGKHSSPPLSLRVDNKRRNPIHSAMPQSQQTFYSPAGVQSVQLAQTVGISYGGGREGGSREMLRVPVRLSLSPSLKVFRTSNRRNWSPPVPIVPREKSSLNCCTNRWRNTIAS